MYDYKKLSYRRETARQLPTWREGARSSSPLPLLWLHHMRMVESESHNVQCTYVKHAVCKAHFKMNRAFKVIQGHPYWCQQESSTLKKIPIQRLLTLSSSTILKLKMQLYATHSEYLRDTQLTDSGIIS